MLFIAIWIAGIYISALRVLNVKTVAMNIYWHFLAKEGIFVRLVIRNGPPWRDEIDCCIRGT
jgi:hypothetical protein